MISQARHPVSTEGLPFEAWRNAHGRLYAASADSVPPKLDPPLPGPIYPLDLGQLDIPLVVVSPSPTHIHDLTGFKG